MFAYILLALGLVMILEGLVYALAPSLVEEMLEALKELPLETRRLFGLLICALGVCALAAAGALGVF